MGSIESKPIITITQYGGTSGPVDNSVEAAQEAIWDFKPFIFFDAGSDFGSINTTYFRQKTLDGGVYGQSLGANYGDANFSIRVQTTFREENRLRMLVQAWDEFMVCCHRGVFRGYIDSVNGSGDLTINFAVLAQLSLPRYYTFYDNAMYYRSPLGLYGPIRPPYEEENWDR